MAGNHRSGRKPKPDALRVLEGGRPRHATPDVTPGLPDAPEELEDDALALRYWHKLGAHLDRLGVMAHEYGDALATLASVSADHRRARQQFKAIGFQAFHTEKRGDRVLLVEAPILRRLEHLAQLRTRLLGEFGLTPAMATKVGPGKTKREPSKWERLTAPVR